MGFAALKSLEVDAPESGVAHLGLSKDACWILRARDREEWEATRAPFIGASEVATLFDLAPARWKKTKLRLYAAKVKGLDAADEPTPDDAAERDDEPDYGSEREWLLVGHYLEPSIALMARDLIDRRNKMKVIEPPEWSTFRSAKVPCMGATPDRFGVDPETGELIVVELKSADSYPSALQDWRHPTVPKAWRLPLYYEAQVQQQMFVLGLRRARVAALLGRKFVHFTVAVNEAFIAGAIKRATEFWQMVEDRTPPPATAADYGAVRELFPQEVQGKAVDLGEEGQRILDSWEAANEHAKAIEASVDGWRARVAEMMGDAEVGLCPDGREFKFASANVTRVPAVVKDLARMVRAAIDDPGTQALALSAMRDAIERSMAVVMKRSLRKPRARSEK